MQHRGTRHIVHTVRSANHIAENKRKIQPAAKCIKKRDNAIANKQITRTKLNFLKCAMC